MGLVTKSIIAYDEPTLEFRYGQKVEDPHDGLTLFGPYDADLPSKPNITYIVIGEKSGITAFENWSNVMNLPWLNAPQENYSLWPPFPGFHAAFNCPWPSKPVNTYPIQDLNISALTNYKDSYQLVSYLVELYLKGLEKAALGDEQIGVAICVVPDEIWNKFRSESAKKEGAYISKSVISNRQAGQLSFLDDYDPELYKYSLDFRRQLKARGMKYRIPLQVIRESTLILSDQREKGKRGLTPISDRMWNLSTTIYYKCGGKPWRLSTAREGVCYIGIAFRRTSNIISSQTACCAAQMFLNTGDGIVFQGEYGPWFSEKKDFHLTYDAAHNLLKGVIATYEKLEGKPLKEIFLHSRSDISKEEFDGYQSACPPEAKLIGIRVRQDSFRAPQLFRKGKMPIVRGSFWEIDDFSGYLWSSGYKQRFGTYDGWEVPVPLRIDIQHGYSLASSVAQDILGLTKLNYNGCKIGSSQPVTIGFSDKVGEILVSNPNVSEIRPNFKFYI